MAGRVSDKITKKEEAVYRSELFWLTMPLGDDFTYDYLGGCILGEATDNHVSLRKYPPL